MATYREMPCKFYIALGECSKGREAKHTGYCQRCNKYEPRARVRNVNRKKQILVRYERMSIRDI